MSEPPSWEKQQVLEAQKLAIQGFMDVVRSFVASSQNASNAASIFIFQQCWNAIDEKQRSEFSMGVLRLLAYEFQKDSSNLRYRMTEVVTERVKSGQDLPAIEALREVLHEKIVEAIRSPSGEMKRAIDDKAKWLVEPVALERSAEIDKLLTESITKQMLGEAVDMAAKSLVRELREKAEGRK